ncbi:SprT-like domain-containing protein [Halomonas sp. PAMB 3232]|uniref:SprT family zinc-dependent metalloprotease n=1 Tax=Halomonas sp. PAMB 3232 TaxID=3075221 RepID=UPI00289C51D8|nr:SprT-like domain-containing protein [Halomonas sp. PAMB 3232]WNL38377.1 SprT-like domain-containing protein [Halomonas sp. PAMB 3232]
MSRSPLPAWSPERLNALSASALIKATQTRVDEALACAREVHPALPAPKVWFDLKGASAGQAHLGRGGLRFNQALLLDNRQAYFDEVIPHEMAHWLVFHLENGPRLKPHGREWQTVMRELYGLAPRVTHRFDIAHSQRRPYHYRCDCQSHYFTGQRHAQARRGRRYACRKCGTALRFIVESEPK